MSVDAAEAEGIIRAGVAALQRGDAPEALRLLRAAAASGTVPAPWFLLAQACRHAGDVQGEASALDSLLEAQPRHLGALVMKADAYLQSGDRRAAGSFYKAALKAAEGQGQVSPLMANELRRAEAAAAALEREFETHIEEAMGSQAALSPRVRTALDIVLGRKQVYLQQPTSFYFPGLPQIEYYEREQFPWLPQVEAAAPAMRAELEAVMREDRAFIPYVESDPNRPPAMHEMLGDPSWGAFHLWKQGAPVVGNAERCPRTMEALDHAPLPRIRRRSPMALFSLLRPGAHIAPHNGLLNTRLICHVPLIVPGQCSLRVGNQVREWEEGKALIFDDSIEHEAENRSERTRVILLFEIWRPELGEEERRQVTALFEAIELYGGMAGEE